MQRETDRETSRGDREALVPQCPSRPCSSRRDPGHHTAVTFLASLGFSWTWLFSVSLFADGLWLEACWSEFLQNSLLLSFSGRVIGIPEEDLCQEVPRLSLVSITRILDNSTHETSCCCRGSWSPGSGGVCWCHHCEVTPLPCALEMEATTCHLHSKTLSIEVEQFSVSSL